MSKKKAPSNCLIIDPNASFADLYEAIDERLLKAQSVVSSLVGNDHWQSMNKAAVSNALWTIQSLMDEAQAMCQPLWDKRGDQI